jgi:dipeptidase E
MATTRARGQIVAMGGGGFSMEPENPLLDDFVLGLTRKRRPRVCFVGTASGDSANYIERFYAAFPGERALATHLPSFTRGREPLDPVAHLGQQDVIYVGGGNTANMLLVWRLHGVDKAIRAAWRRGAVLCGVSAGMICWFEGCLTDSFGPLAPLGDGMGLLKGSACPHYDGEPDRRPMYQQVIREGRLPGGVAADDGAALHYVGKRLVGAVSSRPGAKAWRVVIRAGRVREQAVPTRYLG